MSETKKPARLKIDYWPIHDIIPYEANAKLHGKVDTARLMAAIEATGFDVPIVVDRDGVIIKGHGRRLALIAKGYTEAPVIVRRDLTPAQVKLARLADNDVVSSDYDLVLKRDEMRELERSLAIGVYTAKELDFSAADLATMNNAVFVDDMEKLLADQKSETDEHKEAATSGRVTLAKAFGFKDLAAAGQIAISRLMARAEAATGMKGDEALVTWAADLA